MDFIFELIKGFFQMVRYYVSYFANGTFDTWHSAFGPGGDYIHVLGFIIALVLISAIHAVFSMMGDVIAYTILNLQTTSKRIYWTEKVFTEVWRGLMILVSLALFGIFIGALAWMIGFNPAEAS